MSRRPFVAGNWKMNYVPSEAATVAAEFAAKITPTANVDVAICPTYTSLAGVCSALRGSKIHAGAQNVFWADSGAFTGFISAPMIKDLGATHCIVGHSETRGKFGKLETPESTVPFFAETDETINLKIRALIKHGLVPILCVGETLAEREAGQTDAVIQGQLKGGLDGISESDLANLIVAYEPVWAIGTGKTCDTPEAERVCGMVRQTLASLVSAGFAEGVRVLYGGSVKPDNAAELFSQPNIDGGLVGGASLKADDFAKVVAGA